MLTIKYLLLSLPVIIVFWHAIKTLSWSRGLGFLTIAATAGWIAEIIGLKYGTFFGGRYVYAPGLMTVLNVPVEVIFYWSVFIYTGYWLVNSFFLDVKKQIAIPLLVLADGLVVTAIDLFMDPLQVIEGGWTWLDKGPYFGVPLGNFRGWFLVAVITTGIFRSYQWLKPGKPVQYDKRLLLVPILGYGLIASIFTVRAIDYQLYLLAAIGATLMLPTTIISIYLFNQCWKSLRKGQGTLG